MPVFEVEANGKVFEVEAPNQDAALAALSRNAAPEQPRPTNRVVVTPRQEQMSAAEDAVRSIPGGLVEGVAGLAGLPDLANRVVGWLVDRGAEALGLTPPDGQRGPSLYPSAERVTGAIESVTGELHKPQTRAGEYARTVSSFIPGAMAGPGGVVRNAVAFGAIPGAASELAGGYTKGTALEPWARGGAAIATGGVAGVASARNNAAGAVASSARGVTRQQMEAAEALFQEAQAMGMPLTRPEAIQAVTGGASNLGNLQRVVEGQGGLRDFYAGRAASNDAAAGRALDAITPAAPNPSAIGPAVGGAAEDTINSVRGAINRASDPYYTASANVRLTPQEMAQVRALPGYDEARRAVRDDPQLARYVAGLPDDSVGFLNEVKKYLDAAAENAAAPVNTQRNMQRSAGYGNDATAVRDAAVNASRRVPGNPYETALNIQSTARERYLQPLLDGPIGKIAAKDTTTQKAISVLFPNNPLPNSADEIATAVGAVSRRNGYAARNLVRAHLEMTFNEATQNLAGGANSFGGAKFAAVVRGNPQQAANLEAAVRALPNGDNIWPGVDRFLTVLEAQGNRQAIGSQTAFNQEVLQDLRQGKLASEAGSAILSGGFKLPSKIKDRIERWRMGRNVEELAYLFTDPTAGREFARLAQANTGPAQVSSLIRIAGLAHRGASNPSNQSASPKN